ncbi:MAG: hypothetical protein HZB76_04500 [Chlamydiae bacterium]|nr:hypothetical protein [Chlamydiota bacterium]
MLKKTIYMISLFCFLLFSAESKEPNTFSYVMDNNQFMILVIQDDSLSNQDAKNMALTKASDLTVNKKFKYFEIKTEDEVTVILGKTNWPNAYDFPQNLYQEEIVEKGYDRERFIEKNMQEEDNSPHSAFRMIIQCSNEQTDKAMNPCDYVKCN